MLMNLVEPASGSARVLGCPSRRLGSAECQSIAYVSENQQLPQEMSVRSLFDFCRGMYPGWDEVFLGELVGRLDLDPAARIGTLARASCCLHGLFH